MYIHTYKSGNLAYENRLANAIDLLIIIAWTNAKSLVRMDVYKTLWYHPSSNVQRDLELRVSRTSSVGRR